MDEPGTGLDGNALAGPLGLIFTPDMTTAAGRCGSCGRDGMLARAPLYADAPGAVLRCPFCGEVTLRLVTAPDRYWLDLPAGTSLMIPRG
ncbi:DUF6510 family protein [Actinomadura atramentaria]|uniref:DUF6510 family protein n=1 Tax=Actinomadura atramentaria TaxID=1990 RepID=UPI0003709A03|nr:DUF6510 family protein [Actinomadura atramentaria]